MRFGFHPEAEAEFYEAIDWYEARESGLGLDFAAEVHTSIQRALAFPLACPVMEGDIRRVLVHRFPYGVLYAPEQNALLIVAVMHLHQRPGYWQDRLT